MFGGGVRRSLGLGARRLANPQSAIPACRTQIVVETPVLIAGRSFVRPFSALSQSPLQRIGMQNLATESPSKCTAAELVPSVSKISAQPIAHNVTSTTETVTEAMSVDTVHRDGMIFEIGILFTLTHYIHIFQSVARGLFQSFRPLLILYVFGHILKAVFFIMGAPLWFSFYSIWMFEVGYGLFQCLLSLIFIGTFYGNLLFPRARPSAFMTVLRQQREHLAKSAHMLC